MRQSRRPRIVLGLLVLTAVVCSAPAGGMTVKSLKCEYAVDPIGIDVGKPRLSWVLESERRAEVQTAYRVLVASSMEKLEAGEGDLWDSGKVDSDRCVHVVYDGKPLDSRTRCFWKVRAWDRDGEPSAYSAAARWEMGLLSPEGWEADWITLAPHPQGGAQVVEPTLQRAQWIWFPENEPGDVLRYFRKKLELPGDRKVTAAQLLIAADNRFVAYVNGKEVGTGENWQNVRRIDIGQGLKPGANLVAVEARNEGDAAGLIATALVQFESGAPLEVVTDTTWKAGREKHEGWTSADFDERAWVAAKPVGTYGAAPWGPVGGRELSLDTRRALMFRKEFAIDGPVARARAYVCGLGIYELYINGRRVGSDIFTPGWTYYDKRLQYQTYDVTDMLREGNNAVGAMVGSGWWNGMDGKGRKQPRFILRIEAERPGGAPFVLVTDESWRSKPSPVLYDSFYHGETYDARLDEPGWNRPGFDAAKWNPVRILDDERKDVFVAQRAEPIRVTAELDAVDMIRSGDDTWIFDFGQNASGRCRIKVRGAEPGEEIKIRHAEVLKDGKFYTANYRSAKATDKYFCRGGTEEVWEPRFTYRGFRYAELTGYPGKPPKDALVFRVFHSDAPLAGEFECGNETINAVYRNVLWGQRSNLHSVPTDCPQRDERLGWTGDAQVFADSSCWNMDMARFYTKWMLDMVSGGGVRGGVVQGGNPGWDDVITVLPWTMYCFYGDRRIVEQSYDLMVKFVEARRARSRGGLYEVNGYGDWIAVKGSPKGPIGSAYYYNSANQLSMMAAALGKSEDARTYRALADEIKQAFNARHLDPQTHTYPGNTQTAYALPLHFGIVPETERDSVVENLVKQVVAADFHPTTGFLGTPCILPVLTEFGHHEAAYRMAARTTYPSWGYMVEQGATTIWELWNSDKAGPGMNSRNHFALGAVAEWYYQSLAGIRHDPAKPGFKHVVIRPGPAGDLMWARASYPSMHGIIRCAWKIEKQEFRLNVSIPANTTATVYVPAGEKAAVSEGGKPAGEAEGVTPLGREADRTVFSVGSGEYEFVTRPYVR